MIILVTGADGQLGRAMKQALPALLPQATAYFTSHSDLDLTDARAVGRYLSDREVTHVVNCAAYTAVDRAEEDKAACTAVNVDAVKNLALAADAIGAKVVHVSTDFVFDGLSHRAYDESDKVNPTSHYGASKRAGETALLALLPDSIIVRTSWLYGSLEENNFVSRILSAARSRRELKVVSDQIGSPTRAADLAAAICRILASPQWVEGIYHYCDSGVCSRYDFAKAIVDLAGLKDCHVSPILTSDLLSQVASRPPMSALSTRKIVMTYSVDTPHWFDSLKTLFPTA